MTIFQKNIALAMAVLAVLFITVLTMQFMPTPPRTQTNGEMLVQDGVDIVTQDNVAYTAEAQGYFAQPENAAPSTPGVVMIHEWWGLNDHIKGMARELAKQGYRVIAVDLYNGQVATAQEDAQRLSGQVRENQPDAIQNLQDAVAFLHNKGSAKVASLGWCFGGGQSLQLALSDIPLDATVIYYGTPVTDQTALQKIKWPVLGIFGGKDTSIPVAQVNAFKTTLDQLNIENDIVIYQNVGHAFANPSGMNFAPQETEDAWVRTLRFLNENMQ